MRLDHLLSREKAEAEMRKLIPRSMREISGNANRSSKEAIPRWQSSKSESNTGEWVDKDAQRQRKLLSNESASEICIVFRVRQENSGANGTEIERKRDGREENGSGAKAKRKGRKPKGNLRERAKQRLRPKNLIVP